MSTVSWCKPVPANHDQVFSLHADAPRRGLFRCQTHSHCCLNAARLHPAAAPGPLRDPCPGQDPSLRGPCVLQTPAVLWRNQGCCWRRRTGQERRASSQTRLHLQLPVRSFELKSHPVYSTNWLSNNQTFLFYWRYVMHLALRDYTFTFFFVFSTFITTPRTIQDNKLMYPYL